MVYGIPVLFVTRNGKFFIEINNHIEEYKIPHKYIQYYAKLILHTFIGVLDAPIKMKDKNSSLELGNIEYVIDPIYDVENNEYHIANKVFRQISESDKYFISNNGVIYSAKTNKLISQHVSDVGYHSVSLHINGTKFNITTQRLLYKTWIGPIPEGMEINHNDSIPWRNEIDNLEPLSTLENIRYSLINGNRPIAWNEEDVHIICKLLQDGKRPFEIYEYLCLQEKISIKDFRVFCYYLKKKKKYWKDVSSQYDFSNAYETCRTHSIEQIRKICKMIADGYKNIEIAEETDSSIKYVSGIRNGHYYPDILAEYMIS